MGGHKFGVDQDEILIINVIKRIGWFWGGRAKRVHPKITNSFDNINNNNFFYLHPLLDQKKVKKVIKKAIKKAPRGARTRDIQVKSLTLCRLS
ncbi:hypothetical protein M0813_17171 [Anaeramoeba flamelloides]|uniref:Uncharacterized protein n=1 Tax=Anaeramoeba flamelloides TaxID=1746091 RepID=A0ABQ8YXB5_9EUKA|nr:hypothetical protein M0813_17171 [Anaeramoeba flamelloides]